ncbi:MAG: hypothetical protein NBV60_05740 [Erythrobacter sp.]|nr:hypothetical protein [Erythrobacter sp.]
MKKLAVAGLVVGVCLSSPAAALEHEVVIDHPAGTIAADYEGAVQIKTRQVGAVGPGGRPSTLQCQWSASLSVERTAKVGDVLQTRRSMSRANVASGSKPGWCDTHTKAIDALVDARRDTFRTAMLELVEQDRGAILAEAESVRSREG